VKDGINKGEKIVGAGISGLKSGAKIIPNPTKFDSIAKPLKPIR
jgi:membrane fusion protein (multidrug efflux system)